MALEISSSIIQSSGCNSVTLLDTTGSYDSVTNPTGWGAPNPTIGDITAITLEIDDYNHINTTTYSFSASEIALWLSGGLTLTATNIFNESIFPDGAYTFTLTATVSGSDYVYTMFQGFMCNALCCVRSMGSDIHLPSCNPKDVSTWNYAMNLLAAAFWATCCGNYDNYQTIIDYVNEICDGCGGSSTITGSTSGCSGCS